MMPTTRRRPQRPLGERRYRKVFVIAVEGIKTEPQYFRLFERPSIIRVHCLKGGNGSAPPQVLKRMAAHLKEAGIARSDEAWLVVDKDEWTDDQLRQLHYWSNQASNRGLALSNPKFEYWLLLHFEDGRAITSSRDCSERLKRHIPEYDKGIDGRSFPRDRMIEAVRRAKQRDNPPCEDWPRSIGSSTVYRLVERILEDQAE